MKMRDQFIKVKQFLNVNRDVLVAVAETLLVKLELNADEIERIIKEVEARKAAGLPVPVMPQTTR